jgi:hypothetical protein
VTAAKAVPVPYDALLLVISYWSAVAPAVIQLLALHVKLVQLITFTLSFQKF